MKLRCLIAHRLIRVHGKVNTWHCVWCSRRYRRDWFGLFAFYDELPVATLPQARVVS